MGFIIVINFSSKLDQKLSNIFRGVTFLLFCQPVTLMFKTPPPEFRRAQIESRRACEIGFPMSTSYLRMVSANSLKKIGVSDQYYTDHVC